MKVKELMEKLRQLDPDLDVTIENPEYMTSDELTEIEVTDSNTYFVKNAACYGPHVVLKGY